MRTDLTHLTKSEIEAEPLINNDTNIDFEQQPLDNKLGGNDLKYPKNFKYILKSFDTIAIITTSGIFNV